MTIHQIRSDTRESQTVERRRHTGGTPPLTEGERPAYVGVKMPVRMHRQLTRVAKAQGRPISAVIRDALAAYFDTHDRAAGRAA